VNLRVFFVLMGLFMMAPQVWFLLLFRPPGGYLPHHDSVEGWWVGGSLRLLSTAVLLNGLRLFLVNVTNIEKPAKYSWFDGTTAFVTTGLSGLASAVFLVVYLRYRNWNT